MHSSVLVITHEEADGLVVANSLDWPLATRQVLTDAMPWCKTAALADMVHVRCDGGRVRLALHPTMWARVDVFAQTMPVTHGPMLPGCTPHNAMVFEGLLDRRAVRLSHVHGIEQARRLALGETLWDMTGMYVLGACLHTLLGTPRAVTTVLCACSGEERSLDVEDGRLAARLPFGVDFLYAVRGNPVVPVLNTDDGAAPSGWFDGREQRTTRRRPLAS